MDWEQAEELIKQGKKVRRRAWGSIYKFVSLRELNFNNGLAMLQPIRTQKVTLDTGQILPWRFTTEDFYAEDWEVVV